MFSHIGDILTSTLFQISLFSGVLAVILKRLHSSKVSNVDRLLYLNRNKAFKKGWRYLDDIDDVAIRTKTWAGRVGTVFKIIDYSITGYQEGTVSFNRLQKTYKERDMNVFQKVELGALEVGAAASRTATKVTVTSNIRGITWLMDKTKKINLDYWWTVKFKGESEEQWVKQWENSVTKKGYGLADSLDEQLDTFKGQSLITDWVTDTFSGDGESLDGIMPLPSDPDTRVTPLLLLPL